MELFQLAITQWNYSAMGEPIGLRYEVLPMLLQAQGVPRKRWREVLEDLQVMELEALKAMRAKE